MLAALGVLAATALVAGWLVLRASLPQLDGERVAEGLGAPVAIERDARGTPTVRAGSRADLAFATGFLHAEDRYFQMDLARRLAAGELAELFGSRALPHDRAARRFRLRAVARRVVEQATPEERRILAAYVRGVNAGLAALGSRPWEYWLLGRRPTAWLPEDSILTGLAMWWQLQSGELGRAELRNAVERAVVAQGSKDPQAALRFLFPRGTRWDAPVWSPPGAPPPTDPEVPPPAALDLRLRPAPVGVQLMTSRRAAPGAAEFGPPPADVGSNNWALAGALTADGGALVANDMHLGLGVPATWYPMRLVVAGAAGEPDRDLGGVTMPGAPVLVAGSNGAVAWGYTNSYGDWLDVTRMQCPASGDLVRPDGGRERFTRYVETIAVRGAAAERLEVDAAPSGVRLPTPSGADCDIVAWLATVPAATNLRLLELEGAATVDAALALAPEIGIPAQNLVAGDAAGHVGWVLIGRVPDDSGAAPFLRNTGTLPWRSAASEPRLVDPPDGRLWSANARVLEGPEGAILSGARGDAGSGFDFAARAHQLRDDLRQLRAPLGPRDMLAVQLDDRAPFLETWQRHLLGLLDERATAGHFERWEFRRLIAEWSGRAEPGAVSYRLVRAFHLTLVERTWELILAALDARDAAGRPLLGPPPPQFEGAVWQLVTLQPANFLPVTATSWRAFELEALDATLDELARNCRTLASCGYESNRPVVIRHPLAAALPGFLAPWLDMPVLRLPGDHDLPRVQDQAFGASERFAVEPGHEADGYLEIPGGVSGHPLSPYYRSGFDDWAAGRPAPFRPGPAEHRLALRPAGDGANR